MADGITTQHSTLASAPDATKFSTKDCSASGIGQAFIQIPAYANSTPVERLARAFGTNTSLSFAAGLQSLSSSSTVGQVSASVDLTTEPYEDVLVQMIVKPTNSGSPTGFVEVYGIASDDNSTWTGDVSSYAGSNGSYTLGAAGSPNLEVLGYIKIHANTVQYSRTFSVRQAFGMVPPNLAVVVVNNCGIALNSSGNSGSYRGRY